MPQRRTVFSAFGTLFVVVLAGLGIRVAGGHDPALGTRVAAGGAAAVTQAQTERSTDEEWSDEGGALVAPGARQAPAQAPPLQSGTS
ncbi:MAG: hypothetical protein LT070_06190 [Solirubrobacteraceae bacterium]|nr:hypothetical protein [Solirubrobacteraceae bacterium]